MLTDDEAVAVDAAKPGPLKPVSTRIAETNSTNNRRVFMIAPCGIRIGIVA